MTRVKTRFPSGVPASARIALATAALMLAGPARAQDTPDTPYPAQAALRPVSGVLRNAQAIAPFLDKLRQAATAAQNPAQGPLSIVQIGDSHTAGDMFTNGWRKRWQAEYGSGGRGMTAVGRPYQGYLTWGVTATQSPDWSGNAIFGKQRVANGPLLGLSGFVATAQHTGAWAQLSADSPGFSFDRFSLCGLTGPDKGAVRIATTGYAPSHEYSFTAETPGSTCFTLATPTLSTAVSVTTLDDRPVSLTSWSSTRAKGGIILANLGVVGARLAHFSRNDDRVLATELRQAAPDLLVVAFGTNEGFDPSLKIDEAEYVLRSQIARLRQAMGHDVPILLIGPPDAASNRPEVALPALPETISCGGGWYRPGNLERVRQLQIRLAQDLGVAFWDWQKAMGGACSSMAWVARGMQRGDHVHFTVDGGRLLGDALGADLDQARAVSAR